MAQLEHMIRNLLSRTAKSGDTCDQAEARELLRRLDTPAKFARPKKRHVRIKRVRKPREICAA